jgi:hypothetical protein
MSFFTLFKSRQTRELEARLRFRQGKTRINRFLQQSRQSADKYWNLCRQSYQLGDNEQFRQLAAHYLRTRHTINRWERFLVKLEALEMRRDEVAATGDFLVSIESLTQSILRGAGPEEITRLQADLERAIEKSKAQEEMLDMAMEAAGSSLLASELHEPEAVAEMQQGFAKSVGTARRDLPRRDDLDRQIAQAMGRLETDA